MLVEVDRKGLRQDVDVVDHHQGEASQKRAPVVVEVDVVVVVGYLLVVNERILLNCSSSHQHADHRKNVKERK